ncbi:telomere zinc finger-associated protein [Osmerus eperlanus]|uniref:telomere zinc finger-associated protein n=1 Tax=Osmerus eperlanus TaxID=29151 RepID=UPI002E1078B4
MLAQGVAHAQRVLSSLNQQRKLGQFCDAMLRVGPGEAQPVHRNILACFSQLFQEFQSTSTPCMEVSLPLECSTDGLELVLDFFYTGELDLNSVNMEKVQQAAVSLSAPDVVALCQQFAAEATGVLVGPQSAAEGHIKSSMGTPTTIRKRGRPRKSTLEICIDSKTEEIPVYVTQGSADSDTTTITTITRSGRKVKGPRRLLGEGPALEITPQGKASRAGPPPTDEKRDGVVEKNNQRLPQPATEKEVPVQEDVVKDKDGFDNDDGDDNDRGGTDLFYEDSDEEYMPPASPTATTRRKGKAIADKKENGEEDRSKTGSVQCPTCKKTFRSKYYLKVHNRRHTGEKPFACIKCGQRYFRKENLLEHESRNCAKMMEHRCLLCPLTFKRRQELRLHTVSHTGDMPNKCTTCTEQFMHKRDLTIHLIKVHGFPKPHACSVCPKCFLSRTELRVHEASKHRGEKPFVCEECGHRASSRNGLQMHIKAIHRNERPFVCGFCGHAFTQKANLNMHVRVHTGEKPYQCHLCGKTFRTQASLDKHNRTHTGERPYSCEFCEQRFTEKGPLLRHIASKHQEGRPHCCNICNKTFKAIEQLRVHVRRHKGMRKFECKDCGYKFTRQAHLRRHSQIHIRVDNYNPRQRRLRNLIIEEVEGGQSEADSSQPTEETSLEDAAAGAGSASLPESCDDVQVMIQPSALELEEVVSSQSVTLGEVAQGFIVPAVLE